MVICLLLIHNLALFNKDTNWSKSNEYKLALQSVYFQCVIKSFHCNCFICNVFSLLSFNWGCKVIFVLVVPCNKRNNHNLLNCVSYFSCWTGICSWTGLCRLLWIWWGRGCMRLKEPCDKRSSSIRHTMWQLPLCTGLWSSTRLAWSCRQERQNAETKDNLALDRVVALFSLYFSQKYIQY